MTAGNTILTCKSDGSLSGTVPTCSLVIVKCTHPGTIDNGIIFPAIEILVGEEYTVTCSAGKTNE